MNVVYEGRRIDRPLTEREMEVLYLLSGGMTRKEVSEELCVSESTIHSHMKIIFRKLGVKKILQAVRAVEYLDYKKNE